MTNRAIQHLLNIIQNAVEIIERTLECLGTEGRMAYLTAEERLAFAICSLSAALSVINELPDAARAADYPEQANFRAQRAHRMLLETLIAAGHVPINQAIQEFTCGIDGAMNELDKLRTERIYITVEDEQAIRRAVWSSFHRTGHCPCPYPVGHAHREIWAEETAAIAAEFSEQILPPAPVAVVIAWEEFESSFYDALNAFAALPMGDVVDGEVVLMPEPSQKHQDDQKHYQAIANR